MVSCDCIKNNPTPGRYRSGVYAYQGFKYLVCYNKAGQGSDLKFSKYLILRGSNVGGKNKVVMSELRAQIEAADMKRSLPSMVNAFSDRAWAYLKQVRVIADVSFYHLSCGLKS